MKHLLFFCLSLIAICVYSNSKNFFKVFDTEGKVEVLKKKFIQNSWTEISSKYEGNRHLFFPLNDRYYGINTSNYDLMYDVEIFDEQEKAFKANLYSIIFKHILKGELTIYSPYDPNWFETKDKGFLYYPINSEKYGLSQSSNFSNDSMYRVLVMANEYLGYQDRSGYLVPIKSIAYPGEDSINTNGELVYYPREFNWYKDEDIIAFKLHEEIILDQEGHTLTRQIKSIAPIVQYYDYTGNLIGTKELFWLNYEELSEYLKKYFVMLDGVYKKKIKSIKSIFDERIFIGKTIEQDSIHVRAMKK